MRDLYEYELKSVSGGCDSPSGPCEPTPTCPPKDKTKKSKNNNGFGNGPESGPAPGRSGTNNSPSASDKQNNRGR
jgi:hypothetical protein